MPETATKPKPYITVTSGMSGNFAVMLWWNDEDKNLGGFWEPYLTGIGRYKNVADAIAEGRQWAEAEELEFKY